MDGREIGTLAKTLRQKAEGLRRAGVRYRANAPKRAPAGGAVNDSGLPASLSTDDSDRPAQLSTLAAVVAACVRCEELARCRTQTVFGVGNPRAELCFVGEAPGADEDAQGEPFVGAAGQLLTKIIAAMGLRRSDVYICNVLKCRPPGNRPPDPAEIANCRGYLERQLEIIQPKFICALGAHAAKTLLGSTLSIGRLRGRFHQFRGIPVLCTYHPAYLLRSPEAKKDVWADIQVLMKEMGLKGAEGGGQRAESQR
jgi:DNA polymerase